MKARPFLAVLLAALLTLFGLGGAGWWLVWRDSPLQLQRQMPPLPRAAQFVPRQADLALYLLSDGRLPVAYARAVAPLAQRAQAVDAVSRLRDGAFAAAGLDYETELSSWLAAPIALAFFESPAPAAAGLDAAPGWLLALGSRDDGGARRFLQRFWQTRSLAGTDLQVSRYRGKGLISGRGALGGRQPLPLATALIDDDLVLIASGRQILQDALDASQIAALNQAALPELRQAPQRFGPTAALLVARAPALERWLGLPSLAAGPLFDAAPVPSPSAPREIPAPLGPAASPTSSRAADPASAATDPGPVQAPSTPALPPSAAVPSESGQAQAVPTGEPPAPTAPAERASQPEPANPVAASAGPSPDGSQAAEGDSAADAAVRPDRSSEAVASGAASDPTPTDEEQGSQPEAPAPDAVEAPARIEAPAVVAVPSEQPSAAAPEDAMANASPGAALEPPSADRSATSSPQPRDGGDGAAALSNPPERSAEAPTSAALPHGSTSPAVLAPAPPPRPEDALAPAARVRPRQPGLRWLGAGAPAFAASPPTSGPLAPNAAASAAQAPAPRGVVLALRPQGRALILQADLSLGEPLPLSFGEASDAGALRQGLLAGLRGPLHSLAVLHNPAAWRQLLPLRPWFNQLVGARGSGPLPALVVAADGGLLVAADGPLGWQLGTDAENPPLQSLEAPLAATGLIAAPLELGDRSLLVWTRLQASQARSGRLDRADQLQATLAGWWTRDGQLAWWGRSLAQLRQDPAGPERLRQLEALARPQAPLQWALDGEAARALLSEWQPWRLLSALAGGGLEGAVSGLAVAAEPSSTGLALQAWLELG